MNREQIANEKTKSNQKKKHKRLMGGYFCTFSPVLADEIGFRAATFLDHLNYWFEETSSGYYLDDVRWIYNSLDDWVKNLRISTATLSRAIESLVANGLIEVAQHGRGNRTNSYRIIYSAVKKLEQKLGLAECKDQDIIMQNPISQNEGFNTKNTQKLLKEKNIDMLPAEQDVQGRDIQERNIQERNIQERDIQDIPLFRQGDYQKLNLDPDYANRLEANNPLIVAAKQAAGAALGRAKGLDNPIWLEKWQNNGADFKTVILPAIAACSKACRPGQVNGWAYFDRPVQKALLLAQQTSQQTSQKTSKKTGQHSSKLETPKGPVSLWSAQSIKNYYKEQDAQKQAQDAQDKRDEAAVIAYNKAKELEAV